MQTHLQYQADPHHIAYPHSIPQCTDVAKFNYHPVYIPLSPARSIVKRHRYTASWTVDAALRLVTVLALDRFGDYVSHEVCYCFNRWVSFKKCALVLDL